MILTIKNVLDLTKTALMMYRYHEAMGRETNFAEFRRRHALVVAAICEENGVKKEKAGALSPEIALGEKAIAAFDELCALFPRE